MGDEQGLGARLCVHQDAQACTLCILAPTPEEGENFELKGEKGVREAAP